MLQWDEVRMKKLLPKIISSALVIWIASGLSGCNSAMSPPATATTKISSANCGANPPENKIVSDTVDPNAPYEVASAKSGYTSMASVKENLKNATGKSDTQAAIGVIRAQALRETALSLGARGGLADRAQQINGTLLNYEPLLAKIFQFYGILLDDNILPPVLVEARNTLNLAGNDAIRIADRTYKIIAQARFVTAPPTWREYIWMSYDVPELPDRSLLPRTKPERIMWERDLEEGWQAGLKQADLIYRENVNRLVRDFNGMIMYRKLLAQNMVSPPYVATMDMGVTGNGDDMAVNDRVLRITAFPQLQASGEGWKTEIHTYE